MSIKLPSALSGMLSSAIWASFLTVGRCLPLLREHNRRGELVSLLIDAGDSAWARGAHEVRFFSRGLLLLVECGRFVDGISVFGQRSISSRTRSLEQ
jgi:hypothetical protein